MWLRVSRDDSIIGVVTLFVSICRLMRKEIESPYKPKIKVN